MLINNAGVGYFGAVESYDEKQIDTVLNTNIKGTILLTQALLPMIQTVKGRVLNIVSTAGLRGKVHESLYSACKFAQRGFTESLPKGICQRRHFLYRGVYGRYADPILGCTHSH
ncbi:SDR family oxidoreductase [Salinibacillus xinjiangensis]|uniref:SDR family oxidoreductase n=1 Tax=Salinibacillus xinjiangensis TaxID=1229268 RepID=UPI002B27982E|nr:SDR family oxidoreductase [Salinibacillus xinjiangensis]